MRQSRQNRDNLAQLFDKRLLIVAGKGGVGKSTVSATMALSAARSGRRVLCCEVNTKERIAPLLGARPSGPAIQEVIPNVFSANIRPKEAMREYALMKLRFEAVYKMVFENRVVRQFLRLVPSLAETVILGKILFEVEAKIKGSNKWDLVILDAPATGHCISLLRVPQVLIDTVPPGPMRDEAKGMQAILQDPKKTRVDLVSLPEEMPANETVDLERILRTDLRLPIGNVFLNSFVEQRFSEFELDDLLGVAEKTPLGARDARLGTKPGTLHPAVAGAHAALHHANRSELSAFYVGKLQKELPNLQILRLPRIHSRCWGRAQIMLLSEILDNIV